MGYSVHFCDEWDNYHLLKFYTIGNIGECKRCELIHSLVGVQVERLTLERLHLKIFDNEVVRGVTLVDGVLNRESITHVHTLLLGKGIHTLVLRYRLHLGTLSQGWFLWYDNCHSV